MRSMASRTCGKPSHWWTGPSLCPYSYNLSMKCGYGTSSAMVLLTYINTVATVGWLGANTVAEVVSKYPQPKIIRVTRHFSISGTAWLHVVVGLIYLSMRLNLCIIASLLSLYLDWYWHSAWYPNMFVWQKHAVGILKKQEGWQWSSPP